MSHRPFTQEEVFQHLINIEENRALGMRVHTACRQAGITDTTYYNWRKRFGVTSLNSARTLAVLPNRLQK